MWKTQNVLRETRRDLQRVFHSDPSAIRLLCAGAIRALLPKNGNVFRRITVRAGLFFLTTAGKEDKTRLPFTATVIAKRGRGSDRGNGRIVSL